MNSTNQPVHQRKKENLIQQIRDNKAKSNRRFESTIVEDSNPTFILQQGITLGAPKFSVIMMNDQPVEGAIPMSQSHSSTAQTRKYSREMSFNYGQPQDATSQFASSRNTIQSNLPSILMHRPSIPQGTSDSLQSSQQIWMRQREQRGADERTPSVTSTPMASGFQNYCDTGHLSSFSNYRFTSQFEQLKKQEEKPTPSPSWFQKMMKKIGLSTDDKLENPLDGPQSPGLPSSPGLSHQYTQERRQSGESPASKPSRKTFTKMKSIISKRDEEQAEPRKADVSKYFYQVDIMETESKMVRSDSGDNPTHKVKSKREFIIPMDHPAKLTWNFFILLLTLLNGVMLPVQLGFDQQPVSPIYNIAYCCFMALDICLQARTTIFLRHTGETIRVPRTIAKRYFLSLGFILDMLAALPLWALGTVSGVNLRIFTLIKFFRTQPTWALTVHSENAKLSLKILSLFGYLVLYIHFTACCLHHVASKDRLWQPWQARFASEKFDFYESDLLTQYLTALYTAILILLGDGTDPQSNLQVAVVSFFSITGALVIANIFGTITLVVSALNRKAQKFQEKLDMANTSMGNMNLPGCIQRDIREFMMSTQCNLDTQKELDTFMQMVSPSLRNQVTKHIFLNAIASNPILQGSQEAIDFLINDVQVLLYMPEDHVVSQGEHGSSLYMIAKGDCTVWVVDHMRQQRFVRHLNQGEYFGEISILYDTRRTATVKSDNYCTMAALSKKTFFGLCNNFPQIIVRMREKTLDYDDPWKQFRKKILTEVEYFKDVAEENPFFLDEVQYNLQEEYFEPNSEIVGPDCPVKQMTFVVQGKVDILVFDEDGNEKVLDSIGQGGSIGQYSVLFDEAPIFSAVARTRVRVLTLDQQFFMSNISIDGLEDAVRRCEDSVEISGIPLCDFQKFTRRRNVRHKLLQAKRKAKILETCLVISKLLKEEEIRKSSKLKPMLDMGMWSKKGGVRRQSILQPMLNGGDRLLAANNRRKLEKTVSQLSDQKSKTQKQSLTSSMNQPSSAYYSSPSKRIEEVSSSSSSPASSRSQSSDSNKGSDAQATAKKQIEINGDNTLRVSSIKDNLKKKRPRKKVTTQANKQVRKKADEKKAEEKKVEEKKSESGSPFFVPKPQRSFNLDPSMMYVLSEHSVEDSSESQMDESFSQPLTSMKKTSTPQLKSALTPNFKRIHSPGKVKLQSSIDSFQLHKDRSPLPRMSNLYHPKSNNSLVSHEPWLNKGQSMRARMIQEGKNLAKKFTSNQT